MSSRATTHTHGPQSRRLARDKRAARIAPRPLAGDLRPIVRPGGRKYNFRLRYVWVYGHECVRVC